MKNFLSRSLLTLTLLISGLVFLTAEPAVLSDAKYKSVKFPLHMTDGNGYSLTLAKKPVRIISMTLPSDEILFDMVGPSRLQALTIFSTDADISNISAKAAAVKNRLEMNIEKIFDLEPDLVILASWTEEAKVKQLRSAGISVFQFVSPVNLGQIYSLIMDLALATGEIEKGKSMVREMDKKISDVEKKLKSAKKKSVLDFNTWSSAQGASTSFNELTKLAGLVNLAAGMTQDSFGQVAISKEKLIEADPDILVLPGWVYGDPAGAKKFHDDFLKNPAYSSMKAVKTGSVIMFNEALKSSTSQYFADAVTALARAAYPELF